MGDIPPESQGEHVPHLLIAELFQDGHLVNVRGLYHISFSSITCGHHGATLDCKVLRDVQSPYVIQDEEGASVLLRDDLP